MLSDIHHTRILEVVQTTHTHPTEHNKFHTLTSGYVQRERERERKRERERERCWPEVEEGGVWEGKGHILTWLMYHSCARIVASM